MDFLNNLFKKDNKSVLGIDIGSSSIKVVQLKKNGDKALLETYGELSLGPYAGVSVGQSTNLNVEKIIEAMNDLLSEKEVAITTKVCGMAIPFKASLLSVIKMPEVGQKELETMVPIEARKYIPVPISEVALDWSIIPKLQSEDEDKQTNDSNVKTIDILLAAIHNNKINEYQDIVTRTGIDARFFEIEVFSSLRSVMPDVNKPMMIFDMGSSTTKLYIINRGLVYSSHIINKGSQDITSNIARILDIPINDAEIMKRNIGMGKTSEGVDLSEAAMVVSEYIFTEANRFLFNFQQKTKQNIKSVVLIGGGSALKGFKEIAQSNFKVDVISGNPFEKVEAPAFLEEVLSSTGPEFAVAVGVALRAIYEL